MDKPMIIIDGKKVTPAAPKMLAWRRVAEFDDMDKAGLTMNELMDKYTEMIVLLFGRDTVTIESLDAALDVSDVIPMYRKLSDWLLSQAFEKLKKAPNVETAEAQS